MNHMPITLGTDHGEFESTNLGRDPTVVFACDDTHLSLTDLNAPNPPEFFAWKDAALNTNLEYNNGHRKCTTVGAVAYTYATTLPAGVAGPHHVIVLCNSNDRGALQNIATIGSSWRTIDWAQPQLSFDDLVLYTSNTVLHESMHALAPFVNIGATLPGLPPGNNAERYYWAQIAALQDDIKPANAQSYAMLGTALWIRHHTLTEGNQVHVNLGAFSRKYSRNNRPGVGPHLDRNP